MGDLIEVIEQVTATVEVVERGPQGPAGPAGAGGGDVPDASTATKGKTKLSVAPASATDPIAAGTNDPRLSDARTPLAHTHPTGEVTGLQAALDAKQDTSTAATDAELAAGLAGKSNVGHGHAIADVTNLQSSLDGKADDSDLTTHSADTTAVHGIADTALLLDTADIGSAGQAGKVLAADDASTTNARTPTAHTHDERYYTEAEVTSLLAAKLDTSLGLPSDSLPPSCFYGVDPRTLIGAASLVASRAYLSMALVRRSGTLTSLWVPVATQSGNIDVGIYRYSVANSRFDRLWSSGSQACPAANGWRLGGNPNLAVTMGEVLYVAMTCDNTTATFLRMQWGAYSHGRLPLSLGANAGDGLMLGFAAALPLPPTLAMADIVTGNGTAALVGLLGEIT